MEISGSSIEIDLGPKLELYQRAGVREYITVEIPANRITWRMLEGGSYAIQHLAQDGILRSKIFPGLWLDVAGFCADDSAKVNEALNAGLDSEEHQRFVGRLAASRMPSV